MPVSVPGRSAVPERAKGADAPRNSLDLPRLCDALGYTRYWVAEHHGGPMLASVAPEVIIGISAGTQGDPCRQLRRDVSYYPPPEVAGVFTVLSPLHPRRVDLGLGRASSTDPLTTAARPQSRSGRLRQPREQFHGTALAASRSHFLVAVG